MKLHELSPAPGSTKGRKRVGRGPGSGLGKTSGRGAKGQKARSGGGPKAGFEGGQMPLHRRLPKRGFRPFDKKDIQVINVRDLDRVAGSSVITAELLMERGIIRKMGDGVKLLGAGEVSQAFTIRLSAVSASAKAKIEQAGGTVEVA